MLVKRAAVTDLDALSPLFDAYRQFYGQRSDLAAARAFLAERLRREESVIFLAVAGRPGVRREGVARRLLERAREWAVETDELYESCGWRRDDEFEHYVLLV